MLGNSGVAAQLAASQKGLGSMELDNAFKNRPKEYNLHTTQHIFGLILLKYLLF
jgi:hypothetical protein